MDTKQKILQTATKVFNKKGFSAVTMNELAQEALDMSRGNLTYHFKDKEALLEAIGQEMWGKIEKQRQKSRQLPSFENLHNEVQLYYKFQKEYAFIFLDTHVLNHPLIKQQFREMTAQTIQDNKAAIAFAIQLGNLKPENFPGLYNNIAFTTWMLTFFWLPQQLIRGEKQPAEGEKLIWSLLIPHMTEKGLASFCKFFGKEYLDELGEVFPNDVQAFITF